MALKTLAADPQTAQTYWVLANNEPGGNLLQRQAYLTAGLKHAPSHPSLNVAEGLLLAETGRPREGLAYVRRGQVSEPLSPMKNFGNASYFAAVGLVDEGRQQLANSRRIWPNNPNVAPYFSLFAVNFAEPDEGVRIIESLRVANPALTPQSQLWRRYFDSLQCHCQTSVAGQAILQALRDGAIEKGLAFPALARLGEIDMAFAAARQPERGNRFYYRRFLFTATTAPMRRQARFIDLAAELGLVEFWRASGKWPEYCDDPGLPYDCRMEAARVAAR